MKSTIHNTKSRLSRHFLGLALTLLFSAAPAFGQATIEEVGEAAPLRGPSIGSPFTPISPDDDKFFV